jgi:hypothetical protein
VAHPIFVISTGLRLSHSYGSSQPLSRTLPGPQLRPFVRRRLLRRLRSAVHRSNRLLSIPAREHFGRCSLRVSARNGRLWSWFASISRVAGIWVTTWMDHSSLAMICQRLGLPAFRRWFEHIVDVCADASLNWESEVLSNDTRVPSNAAMDSFVPRINEVINDRLVELCDPNITPPSPMIPFPVSVPDGICRRRVVVSLTGPVHLPSQH